MKKNYTLLVLVFAILPFCGMAGNSQDTVGKKISRIHKVTETTVYVEKTFDSLVTFDSAFELQKHTVLSFDTLHFITTIDTVEVEYSIIHPDVKLWALNSEFSIGLNQTGFSNWAQGGVPSYSVLLVNKSSAVYRNVLSSWKTDFELRYGLQQQADLPWYKNADLIQISSMYGFSASPHWKYSTLLDFKTQLTKSYASVDAAKNEYVSRFFSPMYLTYSIGMEYENKPKTVSLFLTPIAYSMTYVSDTSLGHFYGISPNLHALSRFGPMAVLTNKQRLTKNISLDSKLTTTANILNMDEPFVKVEWNFGLNITVTRNLTVKLLMDVLYDPDMMFVNAETGAASRRVQFRESIFLNFAYRINN
ncbi:MAG: DUF3078 domain-containing protein [Bacteroidales bacterium]|jgi:hypothetical protein|nr:DUF3078 domain-containing protein [Bacteroidales bacterium]